MSKTPAESAIAHFTARAERYDRSSHWCTDDAFANAVLAATKPTATDRVLDVACGTGLVSAWFKETVKTVVGIDLTTAMLRQARPHADHLARASAEALPFADDTFDIVVSRQGIQFMNDKNAVAEMARVTRPKGRICLAQLCAYNELDRDEYFEILRLRNAARKNFYLKNDLTKLLENSGCRNVTVTDHVSIEDVDTWSDHGAISEPTREAIRRCYQTGSPAFNSLHAIQQKSDGRYVDHMLFGIATGTKV